MPDPIPVDAAGPWRWSRRTVLLAGLAAAGTGCSLSDPAVRSPDRGAAAGGPHPTTPSTLPSAAARDQAAEQALGAGARAQRARTARGSERRRDLLLLMERSHAERAAALAATDPTTRPAPGPGSTRSPTPATPAAAPGTEALVTGERERARRYRTAALAAPGPAALLWGSMAVASAAFASALDAEEPPRSATVAPHRPLAALSASAAASALVASLHAAVWGYQLALGKLPASGAAHDRALAGLASRRALQDRLVEQLRRTGGDVPAAAPAYDPDPEVRDADDARLLLQRMETRLLPFVGLWLATAPQPADRALALDALGATARTALAWGAPLRAWPGWPD